MRVGRCCLRGGYQAEVGRFNPSFCGVRFWTPESADGWVLRVPQVQLYHATAVLARQTPLAKATSRVPSLHMPIPVTRHCRGCFEHRTTAFPRRSVGPSTRHREAAFAQPQRGPRQCQCQWLTRRAKPARTIPRRWTSSHKLPLWLPRSWTSARPRIRLSNGPACNATSESLT
jgi:hypothetical protein